MVIQVNPSLAELESLLKLQQNIKQQVEFAEENLSKDLSHSIKVTLRLLQLRNARLSKLLSLLERERLKCLRCMDLNRLNDPCILQKLRFLERLVNEYFLLTEGMIVVKSKKGGLY